MLKTSVHIVDILVLLNAHEGLHPHGSSPHVLIYKQQFTVGFYHFTNNTAVLHAFILNGDSSFFVFNLPFSAKQSALAFPLILMQTQIMIGCVPLSAYLSLQQNNRNIIQNRNQSCECLHDAPLTKQR